MTYQTITSIALFVLLMASVEAALRGSTSEPNQGRRHLKNGIECVTLLRMMKFEDGHEEESWTCKFGPRDAKLLGGSMVEINGVTAQELSAKGAISGGSVLRFAGASSYVERRTPSSVSTLTMVERNVLQITKEDDFEVVEMEDSDERHYKSHRRMREEHHRKLASSAGTLETLVVRVVDNTDKAADDNAYSMYQNIFDDPLNAKSQFEACSYNKVKITPTHRFSTKVGDNIAQGVLEVHIGLDASKSTVELIEAEAQAATGKAMGMEDFEKNFDLVMYCQPHGSTVDGTAGWLAYAFLNDRQTFYNGHWCQSASAQMHEIGHNLGLMHSGVHGVNEYADKSGFMGYARNQDDTPFMCFNAPKSMQLGWYKGAYKTVDPLNLPGGSQRFKLNGVADYKNGDGLVSLRLAYQGSQKGGVDYYVGYNRQDGMNHQTTGDANMVQLFEKINEDNHWNGSGTSYRLAALKDTNDQHRWKVGNTWVGLRVDGIYEKDAYVTIWTGNEPAPTPVKFCELEEVPTDRVHVRSTGQKKSCKNLARMKNLKGKKKFCNQLVVGGTAGKMRVHQYCPVTCGQVGAGQCKFLKNQP